MSQANHVLDSIVAAEVTTTNDVQKELRLSTADMQTLINIAKRGGEVPWSWNVPNASREKVADTKLSAEEIRRQQAAAPAQAEASAQQTDAQIRAAELQNESDHKDADRASRERIEAARLREAEMLRRQQGAALGPNSRRII